MATLVKKFGGSSVATPEKMHGIVDRILRERQPASYPHLTLPTTSRV